MTEAGAANSTDLIVEYLKKHPKQDLPRGPVVDCVQERHVEAYGKKPRDIWRAICKLRQEGFQMKVHKGVYRHDPNHVHQANCTIFPPMRRRKYSGQTAPDAWFAARDVLTESRFAQSTEFPRTKAERMI